MGRKEKMAEKCRKLMTEPGKIRNIGIIAHIDHGKCVAPETKICLADGRFVRADELFEELKERGRLVKCDESEEVYELREPVGVSSLDKDAVEIVEGKITHVWRLKADKLVEVEVKNGRSIRTTPEHKFLVLDPSGEIVEKRADELEIGDYIVCTQKLVHEGMSEEELKREVFRRLGRDFFVHLPEEEAESVLELAKERGIKALWETLEVDIEENSFYYQLRKGRIRADILVDLAEELGLDLADLYDAVEVSYRSNTKSTKPIRLPEPEDLFYLAGLMFGDGCWNQLTNGSEAIQGEVKRIASDMGLEVRVRRYEGKTARIDFPETVPRILEALFDYPRRKKAHRIRVNDFLTRAPLDCIAEFIRGYFDADGTVEEGRSAVSVTSVSREFLEDLQLLLQKFDVASYLREGDGAYTLYVSGARSLERFPGFREPEKAEKLKKLMEKASSSELEKVPISGEILREVRGDVPTTRMFNCYSNYEGGQVGLTKSSLEKVISTLEAVGVEGEALERLKALARDDVCFLEVVRVEEVEYDGYVYDFTVEEHHNFAAEGFVVHNTTLSDQLLAGAGMISEELAGDQLVLDFDEMEQERGITIDAANVSMVHEYEGEEYLINLIDTPGHVDFSGDVTRAMRAVDGAIVVVCAVEGVMPQTETVLRQALRERVRPVLYINKVDRLINELKLSPEEMQNRFLEIISEVNKMIEQMAPEEFKDEWKVSVEDGSVAFGSAYYGWGISFPFMEKTGITFKDIIEYCQQDKQKELAQEAPVYQVVLDMVVKHLPDPVTAQEYRIEQIWPGDPESEDGKTLRKCDPNGKLAMVVTDVRIDEHAGEVATGRVYSGTIREGQQVYLASSKKETRVQQVGIYMGPDRIRTDEVPAGNIAAVTGLRDVWAGETVTDPEDPIEPFEELQHFAEPVVTVAVEAKNTQDLPKLIEILHQIAKEDPTVKVEINEETGQHLVSGMGELHLEIIAHRIKERGVDIKVSEPIVVYREGVFGVCDDEVEGKSPNKHNKFYVTVEPVEEEIVEAIEEGKFNPEEMSKKELEETLMEYGMDRDDAKAVETVKGTNFFLDKTVGLQYLNEVMELLIEGFEEAMEEGPLAKEPCRGVKVSLVDAEIHEDPVHRGPAQVIPAIKRAIYGGMLLADTHLLEPMQYIYVTVPQDYMGAVTKEIQGRRGTIEEIQQEGDTVIIKGKAPVAEMFGFANDIRSATEGRAIWTTEHAGYERVPEELEEQIIREIRERKGLKPEPPKPEDYIEDYGG
ncbi:Translation elongation and release factor (GTPase), contains an intein [Methanopyrus kandleri AV19]|uniref:Elongation factor 2 n=4 Tax=Methanopyrus kandleri TaxID=2320 RepID=EF2_METKA|nr:elongation factor EF-2 [Methanopyrus kandleri]Q8TXJ4.1 RecName: Full=Elongation factor 2; Short=EF-2; Contains: RecName: Full=Mka FusA intein [Methanopyrus kandleri AV19]AAM01894.1 Translation elongation and release factor (GTPase), contains an intein [Methanopyrus kandleri AV19]